MNQRLVHPFSSDHSDEFAGLTSPQILIVGLGESGYAMVKWCLSQGAQVHLADTRALSMLSSQQQSWLSELEGLGLKSFTPEARDWIGLLEQVNILGISPGLSPLQEVFKMVGRVARSDAPVLIAGESGTGKELVAKAVHEYSPRHHKEMITINCGAIPENLLESELFGHEKGSFTGAIARRAGRFEQADGGTLFLDEIGDMPLSIQVKLLRVLQDGSFSRVGSNENLTTDVRIIAATHKNLADEVAAGRFREDLYYRLNVVEIRIPALRERIEDIPLLAEFFLQRITRKNGMARIRLTAEAVNLLQSHTWPGNVRELENTIARACALATSNILLPADIPLASIPGKSPALLGNAIDQLINLAPAGDELLAWTNREIAGRVVELAGGDLKKAASTLQLSVGELRDILKN